MKSILLRLSLAAWCCTAPLASVLGAGPEITATEKKLMGTRWDVATEAGLRAWGDIIFRAGQEFSTMNGPQGGWKVTGPQTVELGTKYVVEFAPGLESFVITGTDGTKVGTGTRKGTVTPVARIIETPPPPPPPSRSVPDPLNLTPPKMVPGEPLKIPLPPSEPPPLVKPTPIPTPLPVRQPVKPPTEEPSSKRPIWVPVDATPFNGKWYRVYLEKLLWKSARDRCKTLGGVLACVHDRQTQDFIADLSKDLTLWIGGTDEDSTGRWRWLDGTEMKYKAWAHFHPSGDRGEDFLAIRNGKWIDATNKLPTAVGFICEWKSK
jgi:hypothetical protein